ncbi:hypothetical protein Poli38472_002699 [Pythium oligandrum]|uniref:PH domain-containing protein n=1 Tax=Pythium oligandrum TaxID=41045 RepID=A0A8K1CJW6_PYTOL|nr:hypothetical protein Poli38472_002699 [Pythium oligandrum]|eukprot:TMW63758.1 hypothetical protein Poli38472_002699 [Pythium oligandrum]
MSRTPLIMTMEGASASVETRLPRLQIKLETELITPRDDMGGKHDSPRQATPSTPSVGDTSDIDEAEDEEEAGATQEDDENELCDVFLNASLQLLQAQSEAKQNVRQLWTQVQRLRGDNHLSDTAVDVLYQELLTVLKSLTLERLEGVRHVKSGYLTLIQTPPTAVVAKTLLFGTKPMGEQRVFVTLSEEQCRLEMSPAREDPSTPVTSPPTSNGAPPSSFSGLAKFKLPPSISWLMSDPLAQADANVARTTAIRLQGCHVRRVPPSPSEDTTSVSPPSRARFQLLVPHTPTHAMAAHHADGNACVQPEPVTPPQTSFAIYVFEVHTKDPEQCEQEVADWVHALDRICLFHLYALERQLRDAAYMLQFRTVLRQHFPICVPLTWLSNRLDRAHGPISAQQRVAQQQQAQRRSSRNLSMGQIIKDLERDRVLVDQHLLISHSPHEAASASHHDSVAAIVRYLIAKAMAFAQRTGAATTNHKPMKSSPSHRLNKLTEAKALAFVERVLRGSSRTQSGGDIYDAISFFCQQRQLSICPVSHDAHPVQMNVLDDDESGAFQVEITVAMQFKVVELPGMMSSSAAVMTMTTPRDWAVLQGTLTRQFTLGKISEPGLVTVAYLSEHEDN